MNSSKQCIYCSGPLFSPEELVGMNAIQMDSLVKELLTICRSFPQNIDDK